MFKGWKIKWENVIFYLVMIIICNSMENGREIALRTVWIFERYLFYLIIHSAVSRRRHCYPSPSKAGRCAIPKSCFKSCLPTLIFLASDTYSQSIGKVAQRMYLCICNAISDRRVRDAVAAGARDWVAVHAHAGCEPNCGQCATDISDEIGKSVAVQSPQYAAT